MKRVVVHVDRLVLKGFEQGDHHRIAADLQGELGRLLADPAAFERLVSRSHASSVEVGRANAAALGGKPARSGTSVAKAIVRGLSK
jgi:hypothetical protein